MLVNLKKILSHAQKERYAVGAFNMTALETALGVIEAAEQEKSPVILAISEKTIAYMGLDLASAAAITLAKRASVPVVVHFDHGRNFPLVKESIQSGFSSVMLDVSRVAESERIAFVTDFVNFAHKKQVTVEAEEDIIGGREDYESGHGWQFTDPTKAAKFVAATGIDCYAVSIGNTHGKPLPHETFDVELLARIRQHVRVPLVLHGASSTPPHRIREAIAAGICKINIDTDLRVAFSDTVRQTLLGEELYDPREVLRPSIEAVKQVAIEKIRLFGSNKKAN